MKKTNIATANRNYEEVKARVQSRFNVSFNQPRIKSAHARMVAHEKNLKTIAKIKSDPAYIARKEEEAKANREAYLDQFEEDLKYIMEYGEKIHKAILTPIGEETVKSYACKRTYAPRINRLSLEEQKALFKDYTDEKINKYTVLEKLTIPHRLILRWALKNSFSLYLDLIFEGGDKPTDLEDLAHDGIVALFEHETINPASFTLEMYKWGIGIQWKDDETRKIFYRAVTNAVYSSKGGRCALKSVNGHKTIKFYNVVYYNNDEVEIPRDDPEIIRLIYGDGTKETTLAICAGFVDTLTDNEKKVLDCMFMYGQKALAISKELGGKEKGFSQYKVAKIYIPAIVEKYEKYRKKESRNVAPAEYATFTNNPLWGKACVGNTNTANVYGWNNYRNGLEYDKKNVAVSLGETTPHTDTVVKVREIKGLTVKA